jgi:hypothetical protein
MLKSRHEYRVAHKLPTLGTPEHRQALMFEIEQNKMDTQLRNIKAWMIDYLDRLNKEV